jgi:hypothetical protein
MAKIWILKILTLLYKIYYNQMSIEKKCGALVIRWLLSYYNKPLRKEVLQGASLVVGYTNF